ncbi:MAG: alpha-ketoacid dehydrogenase subunit beta [Deltaproteobacteria bacterium]|nr:alpha-ketoacid dehydrogenase subunit beta [Deltaproteobacteria bacterium]
MPSMNIIQAVNDALFCAMRRDEGVVVLGEDVGKFGGVFRATVGLQEEFGDDRVIDTPLAEAGIIGTAIGMAMYGLKPVAEIQFSDFIFPAYDQIVNELAKARYRSAGEFPASLVIRTPFGGGIRGGHYHSQSPEAVFCHQAGLVVVAPSNPYDAKGLLLAAIDRDDPVMVFEPKRIYRGPDHGTNWSQHKGGEVPEGWYTVPIGKAATVRELTGRGTPVSLVSYGAMVHTCAKAAEVVASEGIDVELVDLRSLVPLDLEALTATGRKTGRVVVANEAPRTCGFAGEVVALVTEHCFDWLQAPVLRVTGYDTPFPYTLEAAYLPDAARVAEALRKTARFN